METSFIAMDHNRHKKFNASRVEIQIPRGYNFSGCIGIALACKAAVVARWLHLFLHRVNHDQFLRLFSNQH